MVDSELGLTAIFNGCILVPDVAGPEHVFIEANERPGLANHEPQPVAARFVDLLFPETSAR